MRLARSPWRARSPVGATDILLPELDSSLVPCKRCVSLLQECERFCPFCGEDQLVAVDAGDGGSVFQVALMRHGALGKVLAGRGSGHRASSSVARSRLLISIAAAMLLVEFAIALAIEYDYFGTRNEAGNLREFGANIDRAQGASGSGDLRGAERVLGVPHDSHANERLRDAALLATEAPGFSDPAAAPGVTASSPSAVAASSSEPPVLAIPAPTSGVADSKEQECDEALAALALCANK